MSAPNPFTLKHRPVLLLPYEKHDGPYAGNTDCLYLSVGWAQYEPRAISVKSLRHTGPNDPEGRWSRQSEELPIHRALDLALLAANAVRVANGQPITLLGGTLENQPEPMHLHPRFSGDSERRVFESLMSDDLNRRRFRMLRDTLNELTSEGLI